MKKSLFFVLAILSASTWSCKKTDTPNTAAALPQIAAASISDLSAITATTASFSATINTDGGYPITAKGVCWSTHHTPTITDNTTSQRHGSGIPANKTNNGSGSASFIALLTGLTPHTKYYLRVYAINSQGTGYSNEIDFTTADAPPTVTDIDGNVYDEVTIGTQTWMKENLRTTRFQDGSAIEEVTDSLSWATISLNGANPAWCYYDNDPSNNSRYGKLYNWYVASDSRNVCPAGWHVPTEAEWEHLMDYLGGEDGAGDKMKDTAIWASYNTAIPNNSSGFSALPGGFRHYDCKFYYLGELTTFWSSTDAGLGEGFGRGLHYSYSKAVRGGGKKGIAHSIRCIQD